MGKKSQYHLEIGLLGENLGVRYLKQKGCRVLATRYTNSSGPRLGEIDIVIEKGKKIVFVEVKTRLAREGETILPEENITKEKLRKLERIASAYLREKDRRGKDYGFDALSILYDPYTKTAQIRHLEDIFL